MLGLRWMYMHLWMNWIKRTIDIQENLKIVKIYVQSQWRVVLLWSHIFWPSLIQRGRHTQLCIITSLKWVIQICSKFYWWVSKIAIYSPNPHCCLGKRLQLIIEMCMVYCRMFGITAFCLWCTVNHFNEFLQCTLTAFSSCFCHR